MTFVHPPQRTSYGDEISALRFLVAQDPLPGTNMAYPVVALRPELDPNGIQYARANTTLIQPAVIADPERGDGFLFEEFKFSRPSDLAYAADATGYIYVLDAGKDSLFVFTSGGIEGVAPPAGAASTKPSVVSFGGMGDGSMQFNNPQGVAYFNRIVYVADTGNNRISRFRLTAISRSLAKMGARIERTSPMIRKIAATLTSTGATAAGRVLGRAASSNGRTSTVASGTC